MDEQMQLRERVALDNRRIMVQKSWPSLFPEEADNG
jgi:hypothetical protein